MIDIYRKKFAMYSQMNNKEIDGLIGYYETYHKTNLDANKSILKDLSGNNHDIILNNFLWNEDSGYNTTTYNKGLVANGKDNFGLCDNFPILQKDKGFTILCLRKHITNIRDATLLSKSTSTYEGEFMFEILEGGAFFINTRIRSFGATNNIQYNNDNYFTYMTKNMYNGTSIAVGNSQNLQNKLWLFKGRNGLPHCNSVIWAIKIYNRDLSQGEIEIEKTSMLNKFHQETGL